MKVKRISAIDEKLLLTGMIISTNFLKRIAVIYKRDYIMDLSAAVTVADWVMEYYDRYKKAPGKSIKDIFLEKGSRLSDADYDWVAELLSGLSDTYAESGFNDAYAFDRCSSFFRARRLSIKSKTVLTLLDKGDIDKAERTWLDSVHVAGDEDLGMDLFSPDNIVNLTEKSARYEMTFGIPSLDRLAGSMKSEWLVMFLGPMKRGKTQVLVYTALRAVMLGLPTVFITLESGYQDMGIREWMAFGSMASSGEKLEFPYFEDSKKTKVAYKLYKRPSVHDTSEVIKVSKKFQHLANARLMTKSFPAFSAGMLDIERYLDSLEAAMKFTPKVIVIDYLGALKPPRGITGRDIYDQNSKLMKSLSQERKAIVFSAHQGSRKTLEKMNMHPSDVPEDVRILGNLDVLFGLNQTDEEKESGIMRVNVLMHRFRKYNRLRQTKVLQQFGAGQFNLDSALIDAPKVMDSRDGLVGDDREEEE